MKRVAKRRLAQIAPIGVAVAAAMGSLPACMHDFDAFEPTAVDASSSGVTDAARDAPSTPRDASADASPADAATDVPPCTPSSSCLADATSCASTCSQKHDTCIAACQNTGCRRQCDTTEQSCKTICTSNCTSCATNEGCSAPAECAAASK